MSLPGPKVDDLYKRDPILKKDDIQILKEWIKKQPHLAEIGINENQLIAFLHSCYYRIELTKATIDNYFTVKTHCPDLLDALPANEIKKHLDVAFLNIFPEKTPEKYRVFMLKVSDYKTEKFNCNSLIKALYMILTLHVYQNGYENGVILVFDLKGFSLGHLARLNLLSVKKALYHLQEGFPIRLKSVHFINLVPFTDKLIALVKPFMKQELVNMLVFHPDGMESFYKYTPQTCLPEEYGGNAGSERTLNENCLKNLLENYDFFKWHDAQKLDESKRFGKPKNVNTIFGVEGTFKKLEID